MKGLLAILFSVAVTTTFFAQDYNVRGFLFDKEDGEPVAFAKLILEKDGASEDAPVIGATSDLEGFFNFAKLEAGKYVLTIKTMEYEELQDEIILKDKEILTLRYELEKADEVKEVEEINVYADDRTKRNQVEMSVIKLDKKGLERIPSMGAENDITAALSVTPGVVTTGDQGGQIYVRGGTPIQNKILLDGMTIYNPFHSIGFFSVFETELIKSADIYTGGFASDYGGRIASIMDITYRDGNMKKFGGKVSASPFMAKAVLEGPLFQGEEPGSGGSFIFSAKHSLLDYTSRSQYPYANDGDGLPFTFTDIYGKTTIKTGAGSKISLFGFNNRDAVLYPDIANLTWKSSGGGMNFLLVPSESKMIMKGHVNASNYGILFEEEDGMKPRFSEITGFNMGFDFNYFINKDSDISFGFDIGGFSTDFSTFNELNREIRIDDFNLEFATYINYRIKAGRWVFNPGIRTQTYLSIPVTIPEPRLGAKYNITEDLRFKLSAGRYSQNFTAAASDKDVVTLFFGFLSAPQNIQSNFTKPDGEIIQPEHGLQMAWHGIAGFEYDFSKKFSMNIEGYYKYFPQLSNINMNKLYDDIPEFENIDDVFKKDFIIESGYAFGADLVLKYQTNRFYFWGVYSYMISERWDGFNWYPPIFDRRHNINLVGNYVFGRDKDFELSLRWNFGSGLPFTPTAGYYQGEDFGQGVATDYTTSNPNEVSFLLGNFNSERMPTYHRFDLTMKHRKEFDNKSLLETTIGVTNIYNRDNIFYVNRVTNEKIFQLPILPSAGISYRF